MGDKLVMLLLLVGVVGVVGAAIYWYVLPRGNDVRKIDPSKQERSKASQINSRPTVAKTAQLSALRERLADAQATPGMKKLPGKPDAVSKPQEKPWRPEDAGLSESPVVAMAPTYRSEAPSPRVDLPGEAVAAVPSAESAPVVEVPAREVAKDVPVVSTPQNVPVYNEPVAPAHVPIQQIPDSVHILLVDDSKVVRVKTEKLLVNKGYEVTTAVDGIDALAKLETLRPSIIITDIEMPNLDGFGLVRNIRGNLRTAEIPVIVMTSHVNLHLDIAATEGINGFLPKPFNDQDLLDQVAFLCES